MKGKVVVLFTNEPPSDDPKFFGGKALTYYGRWTYKFEEAARRGAKACFIIHTSETAGYPYSVVRPLDGAQLKREPGQPALAFAGWLSSKAGRQAAGPGRQHGRGRAEGGEHEGVQGVPARRQAEGPLPDARGEDRQQQRRRHRGGQRPEAEIGGGRLHRPLGPPRRRPGGPRRRDLQRRGRQRHRLRPADGAGPRVVGPDAAAEAVGDLPRRDRRGEGAARLEVLRRRTRSCRWARRR